jgi:subtilisin family serine protease
MPHVLLGTKNEPGINLKPSADLIAVRTRSRRSLRGGPVQRAAAAEVSDANLVLAFPEAGVEVYRIAASAKRGSVDQRKLALRRDPDVQFAGGVLVDDAGEPVLYTENLFIKFIDRADPDDCEEVLRKEGLTIRQKLEYATNAYFVAAAEGSGQQVFDLAQRLIQREDVEYCHPELVRRRQARTIYAPQWHLKATTLGGRAINAHAHVADAHKTTRGEGITIAIIDDGIDIDHPEFSATGKVVSPRDVTFAATHAQALNPRPKDPDPSYPDNHGTAVAGVACAAGSDGASGVAPAAKLMAIRLASGLGSQQEANAFKWAADHGADVISCSWGPADGAWWDETDPLHKQKVPLPASTRLAIDYAINHGRGGKGCVVLFAAGNGNERVDNDGYASYEKVIAVAACNDRGQRSVYSDYGPAVFCAFPSSDMGWPEKNRPEPLTTGIWTTDRMTRRGYNAGSTSEGDARGNYTHSFGGTSSAAPGAAGVVALALAVNPALKWNEVRDILKRGCDRIDPQGGAYDSQSHSALYGYGRLNAATVVQLACPTRREGLLISRNYNLTLPDLQTVDVALDVSEAQRVEQLAVHIDLQHSYIGDLLITLRPPPERKLADVVLHDRQGGSTKNLKRVFDLSNTPKLAAYSGATCSGRWTLRIADQAAADSGTLVTFGLELKFAQATTAPRSPNSPAAFGGEDARGGAAPNLAAPR